jgi:hypothetical protein
VQVNQPASKAAFRQRAFSSAHAASSVAVKGYPSRTKSKVTLDRSDEILWRCGSHFARMGSV